MSLNNLLKYIYNIMTAYCEEINTNLNKAKLIHYIPDDNTLRHTVHGDI